MKFLSCAAFLSLVLLTSCKGPNHIYGTLNVSDAQKFRSKNGAVVTLEPGNYKTDIKFKASGGKVEIKTKKGDVIIPFSTSYYREYGEVNIPAKEIKQEFDLRGMIDSREEPFDRVVGRSCVYDRVREYECTRDARGNEHCQWVTRDIMGTEDVRETGDETIKSLSFNLVNSSKQVGHFYGEVSLGEQVQHRELVSGCHL